MGTSVTFALGLKLGFSVVAVGQIVRDGNPHIFICRNYYSWSSVPRIFPLIDAEPPASATVQVAKFCAFCGEARHAIARFCGFCGEKFVDVPPSATDTRSFDTMVLEIASRVVAMQEAGSNTVEEFDRLLNLVFSVARAASESESSSESHLHFFEQLEKTFQSEERVIEHLIDGIRGTPKKTLSVALAQQIQRKVEAAEELTSDEEAALRVLLTDAPLTYGYWAPFKKVLKKVRPERYPTEFARATARLKRIRMRAASRDSEPPFESVVVLGKLGTVGGRETREYLLRRQLREYRRLAVSDPAAFAGLATEYLLAVDSQPPRDDIIEGFILNGEGVFRDKWSRRAIELNHGEVFAPPAATGWDSHPDYLAKLWSSVTGRSDFLSFAFQGLKSRGALLPELSGPQLSLALESGYNPLMNYVADQFVQRPETWQSLSGEGWDSLVNILDNTSQKYLLEHPKIPLAALQSFLRFGHEEMSNKAVSVFISRPTEWETVSHLLIGPLWFQLVSKANADQLHLLCEPFFAETEQGRFISRHASFAARALETVVTDNWQSHRTIPTLASLLLRFAMSEKLSRPSADSLARAIFVVSLYRKQVGEGWSAEWLEQVSVTVLAKALVLLSEEAGGIEEVLPADLRGGSAIATRELIDSAGEKLAASNKASDLLSDMWREFVNEPDLRAGVLFIRRLPTSEHVEVALKAVQQDPDSELSEVAHLCTLILKESDGSPLEAFRADTQENQDLWRAIDFEALIAHGPELRRALWNMLATPETEDWLTDVFCSSITATPFLRELMPEDFRQLAPAQIDAIVALLVGKESLSNLADDNALAAATSESTDVAVLSIGILRSQKLLPQMWLQLVESELPLPVAAGFETLLSIKDKEALTDAVLLALDSGVAVVRRRALELVDTLGERLDRERLFLALSESTHSDVRDRVAEEALVASWANSPKVQAFDNSVLLVRREARIAKDLVKRRLEEDVREAYEPTPERVAILLDMAHHGKPRDAEWAHQRLTHLLLSGVTIDNVSISLVNQETNSG